MKFDKIRLAGGGAAGLTMKLDQDASPDDRYVLKDIQGIDPFESDIFISQAAPYGGVYQGRRPRNRQVVMMIGMNPDYANGETIADLRAELYKLYAFPSNICAAWFYNGNVAIAAVGGVCKISTPILAKDPIVQIVIESNWPYIQGAVKHTETPTSSPHVIQYEGTAPAGFILSANVPSTATKLTVSVSNTTPGVPTTITDFNGSFEANDKFGLNSVVGNRDVHLTRSLVTTRLFSGMVGPWPVLNPGENRVFLSAPATFTKIEYIDQYLGV